ELLEACRRLRGCQTGDAKLTAGFRLSARHVIHTVGPVWRGGNGGESDLLASCYRRSLELAVEHGIRSIAFPSISTGAYGFPLELAAPIAISTVHSFEHTASNLEKILFCCFSAEDFTVYSNLLSEHPAKRPDNPPRP